MNIDRALRLSIDAKIKQHGSLREAARKLDLSASYLSRLHTGKASNPTIDVMARLGIRVTVDYEICFPGYDDDYGVAA